jgi:hypothetical protein
MSSWDTTWEAMYEFGEVRPVAWVNTETGEVRHRGEDLGTPRICQEFIVPQRCDGACAIEARGGMPCPVIDVPASRDPEEVEAWLGR